MKNIFTAQNIQSGCSWLTRRDFLRLTGSGAAVATGIFQIPSRAAVTSKALPTAKSTFIPDVEIGLQAIPLEISLFPGQMTRVWTYQGTVISGSSESLQILPGSYLGPIIRVRQGQNIRIHFTNALPEASVIHWHGLRVPSEMDAHPRYLTNPGQTYLYEFEVKNRAGTYWFHPHPDGRTGLQVHNGLAGLFLVSDDETSALKLPSGEFDIPLVIQDRVVDANNQFLYEGNGMMHGMDGFLGDRILVNGKPDYTLSVFTRAYRMRLLNGSNSRIYKLAWSNGMPMTVIGTDGGLLETPVWRNYIMLAPGERVEIVVDFRKLSVGDTVKLLSLEFKGVEMGMMSGNQLLENGAPFKVMSVVVERKEKQKKFAVPTKLSTIPRYRLEDAINRDRPRTFGTSMQHMTWLLNGRPFEMNDVAENEIVQFGTMEVWNLVNDPGSRGMMGMSMAHPIHIHGVQFQVLERQIATGFTTGWETVRAGYVDNGWKDTVMLMPGERVQLLLRFEDFPGLFVYHCHNLEHEDRGMMRNFLIRS